jgi:glutathionylspermidine synthase
MPNAVISRLDLVKTVNGYKMLELNADVPGLLVEAFTINAKVCKELGKINPNRDGELTLVTSLKSAISAGLEYVGKVSGEQAYIVFTSGKEYARDKDIAQYLMDLLDLPKHVQKQYIPIESLWIDENGLYGPDNKQVDVLYRIYPIQFFRRNVFRNKLDGNAEIHHQQVLFHLVQSHKLTLINPSSAFLIESKAVQAVIWALYEAEMYFNIEERIFIERYFLPTYMDPFFKDEQYVIKPVYGREGDTVTIVNPKLGEVSKSTNMTYVDQPMIYQKYVEMPLIETMTEEGLQSLHLLTSCFLTGEQPIGICLRAGHIITDYSWWFVPVCVADSL